jgi:hypothetical protein
VATQSHGSKWRLVTRLLGLGRIERVLGIINWLHRNIEYRTLSGSPNLSAYDIIRTRTPRKIFMLTAKSISAADGKSLTPDLTSHGSVASHLLGLRRYELCLYHGLWAGTAVELRSLVLSGRSRRGKHR